MKAMILAAGFGTRIRPLTNSTPKALVKIQNRTLLEITIERLKSFGIDEILINVHHLAEQIFQFIKDKNSFDIRIEISNEDTLLNTGGGLKKAAWFFDSDEPFIMHNVDVLSDLDISQVISFHKENGAYATLATRTRKTTRYLLTDSQNMLCGWESVQSNERKIVKQSEGELSRVSFMGIHLISPKLLSLLPQEEKFSIIDAYLQIANNTIIKTMPCDQYRWLDLGNPEQLKQVAQLFPDMIC
jgi:NDP-sugar pyrophosphorylase family protein